MNDVHLIERHHDRHAELHELGRQIQVTLEVRCVDDVDDDVSCTLDQIVTSNDFLIRIGRQRVDARQVDDFDLRMVFQRSRFTLDGDSRPVAYVLMIAGELIEQGRLARIGIADQRNRH